MPRSARYFADRPGDLLEIDISRGGGWEPLCAFLGEPVPDVAFPRSNSAEGRKSLGHRIRRRLKRLRARLTAGLRPAG